MTAINTIINDGQNAMFRLRQSSRPNDAGKGGSALVDKLRDVGISLSDDLIERQRAAESQIATLDQVARVSNPKAAAEQRLEKAERRIQELRQEARLAAARGDRAKLAQLAREAALVARDAGKAASEYAVGVSNAAAMGKGAGGAEMTTTVSHTTVTVAQSDVQVDVRISLDDAAAGGSPVPMPSVETVPASGVPVPAQADAAGQGERFGDDDGAGLSEDDLAALADFAGSFGDEPSMPTGIAAASSDFGLARSRWKEADAFGRRIEDVLAKVKSILSEAKAANESDPDPERKRLRRKELDEYDKVVADAQERVNDLRSAAYGSPESSLDTAGALAEALVPSAAVEAPAGTVSAVMPAAPAVTAPAPVVTATGAPSVNVVA